MGQRKGRSTRHRGIKDLGNGTYLVRAHARVNGERIERERKVEASSIQEAASKKRALELEMAAGASGAEMAPRTLGDVARAWLQRKTEARRKDGSKRLAPSTAARYRHAVNEMIVAYVGQLDVAKVKRADIEEWRDHLGEHYASTTVNGALVVLRMIFSDIEMPLAKEVSPIAADDTRITDDEPNALDEEEVGRFLAALRATNPQHYALVLVMLSSGQRISTVLALRWEDVDQHRETITFRRRLSEGELLPGVKRSRTGTWRLSSQPYGLSWRRTEHNLAPRPWRAGSCSRRLTAGTTLARCSSARSSGRSSWPASPSGSRRMVAGARPARCCAKRRDRW